MECERYLGAGSLPSSQYEGMVECTACNGSGSVYSGVEYMGARETVGCEECSGRGFSPWTPLRREVSE